MRLSELLAEACGEDDTKEQIGGLGEQVYLRTGRPFLEGVSSYIQGQLGDVSLAGRSVTSWIQSQYQFRVRSEQ